MSVRLLSRSFAGGEITTELADRVDLGQYQTGLAQCINAIVYPHGHVQKRGGTAYVNRAKYWWEGDTEGTYNRNVQLVPFQFSSDQSYCLEVGHRYVRFHTDGQTLLQDVNVSAEMIRSEGVDSGTANRIAIHKKNHGLEAGKKIYVTATAQTIVGTNRGSRTVSQGIPIEEGVSKNDYWVIADSGTLLGRHVIANYLLRAKTDDPYDIATSIGEVSGTTFTDTTHGTGNFALDSYLFGTGIAAGTYITAMNPTAPYTGTGANNGGTYQVSASTTATGSISITGRKVNATLWEIVPIEDWSQFDGATEYAVEDPADGADPDMFCINVDSSLTGGTPPPKTFSKITRAKQANVFATAHGFNDGDIVYFTKRNQRRPDKVNFNDQIPYKVSDKTTDTFKIKVEVEVDEDGTTEWQYLNTKKAFKNGRLPKGFVSSTAFVPDVDVAAVQYTVIRAVTCEGDDVFIQESHGLYTGQVVWYEPELVAPWNRTDYYQVNVLDADTFNLVEIDNSAIIGAGESGIPALAGYIYPLYEIETEYDSDDIPALDFTQSYDVITIVNKNYAPKTLRRLGANEWEFETEVFIPIVDVPSSVTATVSGNSGTNKRKMYYAVTAVENDEESFPAYIERPAFEASKISSSIKYEVVPYFFGDGYYNDPVGLNVAYGPAIKLDSGSLSFGALVRLEAGDTMSDTFIEAIEGEDMNDNLYRVVARLTNGWYILARRSKTPVDWGLFDGDLTSGELNVYRSGSVEVDFITVATCRVALSWKAKPGVVYNVYKRVGGNGGDPLGYIGRTDGGFFSDDGITPDMSITPPLGESPFLNDGNYPGCVDYFEQRKVFGGTDNRPQNVWLTRTATERNMLQSLPVRDTDAINFRMAGREQNAIKFMAALQDLILFTENSEWRVSATDGSVLTPASVQVRQQSANGCSDVKPVVANGSILFVQSGSNRVLEMNYNWNANGYSAGDVSMLAYHLFENHQITAMTLERGTFPVLWCLRDDGILLAMTYVPEQKVIAWHRHETDGVIISVRAVKEANGPVVYLAVRRDTASGNRVMIERMDNYTHWLSREYFDCVHTVTIPYEQIAYSSDEVITDSIMGFAQIANQTVMVMLDGYILPSESSAILYVDSSRQTVGTDGSVSIPDNFYGTVKAGLWYSATVKTLPVSYEAAAAAKGNVKNISKVFLRASGSGIVDVSPSGNSANTVPMVLETPAQGEIPQMKEVPLMGNWDNDAAITITHSYPGPFMLQSMVLEVATGG